MTCGPGFASLSQERAGGEVVLGDRPSAEVSSVRVVGVEPALAQTLVLQLATKVGVPVADAPLRDDVRRLWKTGVVADARVELDGTGVVFVVEPRDVIGRVTLRGFGSSAQGKRFGLLAGTSYEPARLQRMADAAQLAYIRAGHTEARVEIKRATGTARGVPICVAANPGPKLTIAELVFPGREAIPAATLIDAMRSTKVNRVGKSWDAGALEADKVFLQLEYWERGHANVRIGEPRAKRQGSRLIVEVPIEEGPVFRFGRITASHRIDTPALEGVFARSKVTRVMDELRALPGVGDVTPRTSVDIERRTIDIVFDIQWRWPWHVLSHWRSSPS